MSATSGDCFADQQRRKAEFIMRQTDYTMEQALEQLTVHAYDPLAVIKAYMGVSTKKPDTSNTVAASAQQQRFKEIRGMMDDAAMNFLRQREIQRMQQRVAEARAKAAEMMAKEQA
jgi:hypothetical protein